MENTEIHIIEQLKEQCELKTKWLSLLSHDCMGVLSNIKLLLDAFENKSISQEIFMSMLLEVSQITNQNIKTLTSTNLWLSSQMKGFSPHIEEVKIYDLYLLLDKEFAQELSFKEISLKYIGDQLLSISTDKFLLMFIIKQLLENAVKYSKRNDKIELIAQSDSNRVHVTIKDSGLGMSGDVLNKLGTLDGSPYTGTMKEKGAGLSMVIIKDFVEMLNGKMGVYSIPNEGSSVELIFPVVFNVYCK